MSIWRLRSAGHVNAAGLLPSRAQRSSGWGEHYAANRGGVAVAGPQHITSSVPTEFEGMLGEAAVLAPEGLEHPLQYLRSRILARHFHAMLKRGVTLVTVYLEPGLRASGSTCGFWRCLRPVSSASMDPGSPWGTGTWSRRTWPQVGWLDTVNGKVAQTWLSGSFPRR